MDGRQHGRLGELPDADAPLRYGYVPGALRQLRRERRQERRRLVSRLALLVLVVIVLAGGTYPWSLVSAQAAAATPTADPATTPLAHARPPRAAPAYIAANADAPDSPVKTRARLAGAGNALPSTATAEAMASTETVATDSITPTPAPTAKSAPAASVHAAAPTPTATPVTPLDAVGLANALSALIAPEDGTYSITVIDLRSGQEIDLNDGKATNAASVNKLEILAALYHEVERGRLSLSQTLTTTDDDIQDYGTGVIRYQPVGSTYTLAELAKLLIEQSDNTASYMLAQTVGLDTIEQLVEGWGLHATHVGQDVSTARDAAHFLTLLYQGKLANKADTAQMIDYLSHTAFNDRIPAGVPPSITVAHKIGNQVNVYDDAGIVYLTGRPYILSIFSEDIDMDRAIPVEQQLSKTVYDYERQAGGGQ